MYISKITLENFKGFKGKHTIEFNKGMNFFVGNNNTGKTTAFKAIDFILNRANREDIISNSCSEQDNVAVEIELRGEDLADLVTRIDKLKKYQDYLIDDSNEKTLRIMRSSENNEVEVKGKKKTFEMKNVRVFNPTTNQFENPSGTGNTITALLDAQFVWSDIKNEDFQDFSNTKIVGKLISAVVDDFKSKDAWKNLEVAHKQAFGDDELRQGLSSIENIIGDFLKNQYGETKVQFDFEAPQVSQLVKMGDILLGEGDDKTSASEKGTGLQRALVLSIIQAYGQINKINQELSVPTFLFIDEPETFLHPQAQDKLLDSLENISQNSPVFITTHSPYLLKRFDKDNHKILTFSKDSASNKVEYQDMLDLFGEYSPSWGEINYFVFGVPSVEFHNELYGYVQSRAIDEDENNYHMDKFDAWLENKNLAKDIDYTHLNKDGSTKQYKATLPTYIRNIIHHPENTNNRQFTPDDLGQSTKLLIRVYRE